MIDSLKLSGLIALVLCFAPAAIKKHNWWEDSRSANHRTSAWHPNRLYSPDVEDALVILGETDGPEVRYLRSRGNPINFVPGVAGRLGDTTPDGVIELPRHFQSRPAEIAVILSHEILHAERHDPFVTPPKYPLWRRLLWHTEEEEAHCKSLWTAVKLWPHYHAVWRVLNAQWLFEPPLYLFVGPQCIAAGIILLLLTVRVIREVTQLLRKGVATQEQAAYSQNGARNPSR